MIQRIRLLVLLARPAVLTLFGLFTATGLAQAGHGNDAWLLAKALTVVISFVLFAVAVNDIADARIDRVNLPHAANRPLAVGTARSTEMVVVAIIGAVVALGASTLLYWPAPVVVAGGLLLAAAYSLRPFRISHRGVLAPMLLPAGYVAVPYLVGIFAARGTVTRVDLLLLAGLYAGFIGRIVLKDFRDVRGDALFGKRTFLVRHGRRATCAFSAAFLLLGLVVLPFVREISTSLVAVSVAYAAITLALLRALSRSTSARRDEALISAVAILGRALVLTLCAHFAIVGAQWAPPAAALFLAALATAFIGSALRMARRGPLTRTFVPHETRAPTLTASRIT